MRARLLAAALVVVTACAAPKPLPIATVTFTQGTRTLTIRAEVAASADERDRGLMGRGALGGAAGMLFLFPRPVATGFWMKDTLIPLDIAFISRGIVREVDSMAPCRSDPCPVTTPAFLYDEALEAAAGVFASARIGAGAQVSTSGTLPRAT